MTLQIMIESWFHTEIALVLRCEKVVQNNKTVDPRAESGSQCVRICSNRPLFGCLTVYNQDICTTNDPQICSLFTDISYFCANFVFSTDFVIKNVRRILILIENASFCKTCFINKQRSTKLTFCHIFISLSR